VGPKTLRDVQIKESRWIAQIGSAIKGMRVGENACIKGEVGKIRISREGRDGGDAMGR